jgi:hypothetical protein
MELNKQNEIRIFLDIISESASIMKKFISDNENNIFREHLWIIEKAVRQIKVNRKGIKNGIKQKRI